MPTSHSQSKINATTRAKKPSCSMYSIFISFVLISASASILTWIMKSNQIHDRRTNNYQFMRLGREYFSSARATPKKSSRESRTELEKTTESSQKDTVNIRKRTQLHSFPTPPDKNDKVRYHVVFSTDCSEFQHWQSYVLFYHVLKVGQPGNVTRIASGCNDKDAAKLKEWHDKHIKKTMSDRFELHLTPDYTLKEKFRNQRYKFTNKPFGLLHWMEHGEVIGIDGESGRQIDEDAVIILIDPDMVLLRPIGIDFSNDKEVIVNGRHKEGRKYRVEHGSPFAQKFYGLEAVWRKFNLTHIAGPDSPAKNVSWNEAKRNYPAGPPYIATARDMYKIAVKWAEFAPKVFDEYPKLYAEMFAYCIAAAHSGLPHQLVESLAVSEPGVNFEAWPFVDVIPAEEVCDFGFHPDHSKYPLPNVLHYCQRYMVGDWFFGKRRLPKNFFTCEFPLLVVPPMNIALKYDYRIPPPPHKPAGEKRPMSWDRAKRETFALCVIISSLNEAGEYFKKNHCDGVEGTRKEKSVNLWNNTGF